MSKVALLKCDEYDFKTIYNKIKEGLDIIGGIDFVQGKKVLLKPNLLAPSSPEKAVTTHPVLLKAVIRLIKEAGGTVLVGDSPGIGSQSNIYGVTGIEKVVQEEGAKLANFKDKIEVENPNGKIMKKFTLAKVYEEVDYIISLPKLKTHGMTYYTGAIKNLFGMIPGLLKPKFHYKFPEKNNFGDMLADLNLLLKPKMAIMDAIIAMEGNGPRNGDPKKVGAILISKDLVALDSVACNLIGLNPKDISPIQKSYERGLGQIKDITVEPETIEELCVKDFKKVKKEIEIGGILPLPDFINNFIREVLVPKPKFDHKKCILCNECVKVCPSEPKSLKNLNDKIEIDRKSCIRCFCCQEMCPVGAIESKRF
ncbi:MAG: DUF362 domain-containing protein [Fusobacteriota bacterium]